MVLEQDYAWVKQGMLFPFLEYMDRCVEFEFLTLLWLLELLGMFYQPFSLAQVSGADEVVW